MALIVEDGLGIIGAESFASVAQADARLASLGMSMWAALSEPEKEQALRRAAVHMENVYRPLWKGIRKTFEQGLSWPRYNVEVEGFVLVNTYLPLEVIAANIDLALRAATGDLNPDLGGNYPVKKKVIGPIEKEYDTSGSQVKSYRAVTMSLVQFLNTGGRRVTR